MEHEVIVFFVFVGIHTGAHFIEHFKECKLIHKMTSMHVFAVVIHPVVFHAIQEYVVHIIVYSGRILGH